MWRFSLVYILGIFFNFGFILKGLFVSSRDATSNVLVSLVILSGVKDLQGILGALSLLLWFFMISDTKGIIRIDKFLRVSIFLMVLQKIILFRSDFSGGFGDSINTSGSFAVIAIYLYLKDKELLKSRLFLIYLIMGFVFSEAKVFFYILPLLAIRGFGWKRLIGLLTALVSVVMLAPYLDQIISWSNNSNNDYFQAFLTNPTRLIERLFAFVTVDGTQQINRVQTILYYTDLEAQKIVSGFGSGALSKGLIGNGMLSELKLFRSGLSMLLFEYGLLRTIILLKMMRSRLNIGYFWLLFLLFYSSALLSLTFALLVKYVRYEKR